MFTVQKKTVFYLTLGYFLRAPDNSNFFRFPLKVRVIGSRLYLNGSLSRQEPPNLQSNLWLTSWTFLCFLTLFLLVHLPCMQCLLPAGWPHMFYGFTSWTHRLCSQCLAYLFTILVSFKKCSFNSIAHYSLTSKTHSHQPFKHQHEITHFEVTFQLAWSYLQLYLAPVIQMLDSTIQRINRYPANKGKPIVLSSA